MRALFDLFMAQSARERGLSPKTLTGYRESHNCWRKWFQSDAGREPELADWTKSNAAAFHTAEKNRGIRQSTRRGRIAAIRAYARWLVENGHAPLNPWLKVRTPVNEELHQPCPNVEEVQALFDGCDRMSEVRGKRAKAALALLALAGLRLCEMCAVNVADVNLTGPRKYIEIPNGKGRKRRTVPLNALACSALCEWLAVRPASELPNLLFQFGEKQGHRPFTQSCVFGLFETVKRLANLRESDITAHALRRFAATSIARMEGGSIADAQRLLGHSSANTTLRYLRPANNLSTLVEGIMAPPKLAVVEAPPIAAPAQPIPTGPRRSAWRRTA